MSAPDIIAPDRIADHLIVGAADLAHFIYGSDEQRSSAAFAISARSASGPCRISSRATRSARAAAPSPPGSMPRMALALADACTKLSRERLNELAAMTGLHTPHVTPPGQEIARIKTIPEAQVNLPLIVCIVKAACK
jgi:hypothetical protein